ncbi:hypothetical protein KUTeg_023587 [Tegillarca granosa]|uniref:Secreted protein n=1 Tax=Tegillarca granosa TaxID=220873 RepID=A0ABQ9E2M4_TEGGR|nr:hypothetical protein KUTeg_023587 [Tegillarca granosa]
MLFYHANFLCLFFLNFHFCIIKHVLISSFKFNDENLKFYFSTIDAKNRKADQICYAVLCVFSYIAAGREQQQQQQQQQQPQKQVMISKQSTPQLQRKQT